jgi:hypothetical protein
MDDLSDAMEDVSLTIGQALVPGELVIDHLLLPEEVRLVNREHEVVEGAPDGAEVGAHILCGALVDGIVRQVHLEGSHRLDQAIDQLGDL